MTRTLPLALLLALSVSLAVSQTRSPRPRRRTSHTSGCGPQCGSERWPVKTLSDRGAAAVLATAPQTRTVADLVALRYPSRLAQTLRVAPIEKTQVTVTGLLIAWKLEAHDRDFHLVIADPNDHTKTLIAEIPDPHCSGACASGQQSKYAAAREALQTKLGPAPRGRQAQLLDVPARVQLTGPGFFDYSHHQDGLAPNCIEIHPVLEVKILGSVPGGAIDWPRGITHTCGHSRAQPRGAARARTATAVPRSTPAGVTAVCRDGSYSSSTHRSGTCSGHGGVVRWLK